MLSAEDQNRLRTLIQERMAQSGTSGVALAVVFHDEVVFARGFGVTSTDPEQAVPITPQTVFRIGSSTKPLTGTLLMRLVDAGLLALDEPIVTYLPWFQLSYAEWTSLVTLRHLLSHQSGLPWGAEFFGSRDGDALEAYVRDQVPRMPLIAPPGVLFSYSNIGVNISGCVAEAVGGAPFADLMQTWVFDPLGMARTTFDPLKAISFPLAQAHEKTPNGVQVKRGEPWAENVAYRPSAMAYSTVSDMANVARLYLNSGEFEGQRLLLAESVAEMHRTQGDEYQADSRTVGLNFALTHYRGFRRVGHGGGIASFGSVFTMLPEIGAAVILQFNESTFWPAAEEITCHIFDSLLAQAPHRETSPGSHHNPNQQDEGPRRQYAGTFLGPRSGLVVITAPSDGNTLTLSRPGTPGEIVLTPLRDDLYTGQNADTNTEAVVGFIALKERSEMGVVNYVMLNGAPCVRIEPNPSFIADPNDWHGYLGTYEGPDDASPSGRDMLTLTLTDDTLHVHSRTRGRAEAAIPWDAGCFVYRGRFLRFRPDASEKANAFTFGDETVLYTRILS